MVDTNAESAPPAGRRPRRRQAEIRDAAARVFFERGYESTSIQDVAAAVGILKGSLYYYIESKEDLLWDILQGVHVEAMSNIERTQAVDGTPLEKIRAFVTFHLTFNAENLIKMSVFFNDFRSLSDERRQQIVGERDNYELYLRQLIELGQAEGEICPDIDAKLIALGILGMTNWIYHWFKPDGQRSPADVANAYADFVVAGLACSPETHVPGHRALFAPLGPKP